MADRRKTQKNHIRAARDWLGQAEHLLDHENDVQGDLKLMLARAELSKVQESPRGTWFRCWGLRLVPALLALVIAAGGGLFWHQWQRSDVSATSREAVLAGEHKSAEESPTGAVEAPVQQTQPKPQSSASAMPASLPATQVTVPEPAPALPRVSSEQPVVTAVPGPPAPATQKLMQSAGKILRQ